ncbi:YceD family protein [Roseicyclus persicicus]|uniref:DUF177 domain-containing protein n=1 Tax=Roseicyclus persicicus TaxID=2650661 RepID=A0A7X6H0L8_9RHOB|nr:YceD family protein [Roseibacterium persicicum]NKX45834.1 DUF177 domain-containing protein [Roseibacterium persicicum]
MAPRDEILHLARLPRGSEAAFDLRPEAEARAALAAELGLIGLRKLRFAGRLVPEGKRDWRLEAELGATVVQPCVVTTEPVTTRLDEPVLRRYLAEMPEPEGADEVEMPEDDTAEPLPATLDLGAVMAEALALALPLYPRAPGSELGEAAFAPPGVAPLTDEDAKPLAGLAALRDRLKDAGEPDPEG